MDFHKLPHDLADVILNGHFPFSFLLFGLFKISKLKHKDEISELGDVPGDNVLPKNILISLPSRKGL
jgi:hypothetical protein